MMRTLKNSMQILIIALLFTFISGCDPLGDSFFKPLFNADHLDIFRACESNDLSAMGQGRAIEIYHLSDKTFADFVKSDKAQIPRKNSFSAKFEQTLTWTITPLNKKTQSTISLSSDFFDDKSCFDNIRLQKALKEPGNFVASYYDSGYGRFSLFVLEAQTQDLLVMQEL